MNQKIQQLLNTPRMYYYDLVPQNSVQGLYKLITDHVTKNTNMVEIGSFSGVSSELFAIHCKHITCVDKWSEYHEIESSKLNEGEKRFDQLVSNYNNITKMKMSSEDAAKNFEDKSLDFVYIDAAHDYDNVKKDILCWLPKVKSGGYLAGHDIVISGVDAAVREIFGGNFKDYEDTSWITKID